MSGEKTRASGGASLLTEQATAELRNSAALKELVGTMRHQEADLVRHAQGVGLPCMQLACQLCVTEMLGDEIGPLEGEQPSGACAVMGAAEFAQTIFALRGAPKMALRRREAREVARAYMHLNAGVPPMPQRAYDFQALWEMAMEGEPRLSKEFPSSSFRIGTSFIIDDQKPGGYLRLNTSPERIVDELEELVAFMRNESLPPEVRAAAAYASCMFTHPFDDGNGHTGRMLLLFTMASGYSLPTNVCISRVLAVRRKDLGDAVQLVYEGASTLTDFCLFVLRLLHGVHREAASLLESARSCGLMQA